MALAARIDSIESLPEPIAKEYKKDEKSGKYVLDVTPDGSFELSDTSGLKSALSKERGTVSELKKAVTAFEGLDPAAAREALAKVDEMKTWTPTDKVQAQINATKADLLKSHGEEKQQLTTKLQRLEGSLRKHLVTGVLNKAISEAGGRHKLLLPVAEKSVRVVEKGDDFDVEVIGDDGNVRVNGSGANMTIGEYIAELKSSDDYAPAFNASGASGTGAAAASPANGGGGTVKGGKIMIRRNDRVAMNDNIDKIASGEAVVVD